MKFKKIIRQSLPGVIILRKCLIASTVACSLLRRSPGVGAAPPHQRPARALSIGHFLR